MGLPVESSFTVPAMMPIGRSGVVPKEIVAMLLRALSTGWLAVPIYTLVT